MKLLITLFLIAAPAWGQFTSAHSIWSRPIDSAAPTDGYAITWSASQGKFVFTAGAAGPTGPTGPTGATGSSGNANGITVYSGAAGVALSGTKFFPVGGGNAASATETDVDATIATATTFQNFGAEVSAALGGAGGNSVALTIR